jgi:hypothetical protein
MLAVCTVQDCAWSYTDFDQAIKEVTRCTVCNCLNNWIADSNLDEGMNGHIFLCREVARLQA